MLRTCLGRGLRGALRDREAASFSLAIKFRRTPPVDGPYERQSPHVTSMQGPLALLSDAEAATKRVPAPGRAGGDGRIPRRVDQMSNRFPGFMLGLNSVLPVNRSQLTSARPDPARLFYWYRYNIIKFR